MKKMIQATIRRHENARLDRARSAVINARFGGPRHAAYTLGRPTSRQAPGRQRKLHYAGPRYVTDGNLITILPTAYNAERVDDCTCTIGQDCGYQRRTA